MRALVLPQDISYEDAARQVADAISAAATLWYVNPVVLLKAWDGSWFYMRQAALEAGIVLVPGRPTKFDQEPT